MSWVIELRRADAVKLGDLMLAQHEGVVGAWRVTDTSMGPHPSSEKRLAVTLRLTEHGQGFRPPMLQLHDERALVLMLVAAPEPERCEYPHGPVIVRSGRLEVRLLDE